MYNMNTRAYFKTKSQTKIKLVSVSSTYIPQRVPSHVRYQNKKCAFPLTTESRYVLAKLSPLGPFWLNWRSFGCMWVSPGLTRLHLVQREIASDHLAGGGWLDAKNQVGERGIALWEESGVWYAMKVNQFGEGIHLAITGIEESQITGRYLDHGFWKITVSSLLFILIFHSRDIIGHLLQ